MSREPWGCSNNFMVPFYAILWYRSSCSAFRLEVFMSKKHLTYDDRLAIQAKERYTEEEIRTMMNHINSYQRKKCSPDFVLPSFKKFYTEQPEKAIQAWEKQAPIVAFKISPNPQPPLFLISIQKSH